MAKHSLAANGSDDFWPYEMVNDDVRSLFRQIKRDPRRRTLPAELPSVTPDGRPQVFANQVPIAVNDVVARKLLEYNTANRKLSYANIERLAAAMVCGAWMFNGKSSSLPCSNQEILDLQHTLHAVIRAYEIAAERKIEMTPILIIPTIGLDPSSFFGIDVVRPRQTRDTLTVAEKVGMLSLNDVADNECSTALRVMLQFENMTRDIKIGDPRYLEGLRSAVPNYRAPELMGYFPQLTESLAFCNSLDAFHARRPIISIALGGALHAIISDVQSVTAANNFVKSLVTGVNLEEHSPIYRLREQLIVDQTRKVRAEAIEKLATCIRAWNMLATHRPPPNKGRIKSFGYKDGHPTFPIPMAMQRRRPSTTLS